MIEHEINITKDGFNIQTDVSTFKSHYKRLGWSLVGRAPCLPQFDRVSARGVTIAPVTENTIAELNASQLKMW